MVKVIKKNKPVKPLPFPVYLWIIILLTLAGLADSIYLTLIHYHNYTDIGYKSFCAISRAINCDTVSQSQYSIFLNVPVSVWGIIGYLFFLTLTLFAGSKAAKHVRLWPLLFIISFFFSCCSMILAFISTYYIHSYCIMCIISYVTNFLLLYYTWLVRRRFEAKGIISGLKQDIGFIRTKKKMSGAVLFVFAAAVSTVLIFYPDYWKLTMPPLSSKIATGTTEDGNPWIGAENPELVIVEYTDYMCFQCRKMHYFLRRVVAENQNKIRLVHIHYPMDQEFNPEVVNRPFHMGSGKLALFAIYAETQGKFWEMNDVLFDIAGESKGVNVGELSKKVGLNPNQLAASLHNRNIKRKLGRDIWHGMKLRIVGTPSYVIDDKVYQGQIPPEIIKKYLN